MVDDRGEALALGEGQRAWRGDGILEVHFVGMVGAAPMRPLAEASLALGAAYGVGAPRSVVLVDLSQLEGFSPEARKVFGSLKPPVAGAPLHVDVVVVGATLKTKALFLLMLTASRLLGDVRADVRYAGSLEEGRRVARERRDAHRTAGQMK